MRRTNNVFLQFLHCRGTKGLEQAEGATTVTWKVSSSPAELEFELLPGLQLPHESRERAIFVILAGHNKALEEVEYEIFEDGQKSRAEFGTVARAEGVVFAIPFQSDAGRIRLRLILKEQGIAFTLGPVWIQSDPINIDHGLLRYRLILQSFLKKRALEKPISSSQKVEQFLRQSFRIVGPYLRLKYVDQLFRSDREYLTGGRSAKSKSAEKSATFELQYEQSLAKSALSQQSKEKAFPPLPSANDDDVKIVAFYLPQFHPIPENDRWWGKGFTEWTNVSKAMPQFLGHLQPRLPGELGFYDLRLIEVMKRQAELAQQYGIHGFCFHYYWFNGKRLLERPLDQFLSSSEIDLPFCLCWANENWTRRWDGAEQELLIEQEYSPADDIAFIRSLQRFFVDRRYIKIEGKPLLVVYNPALLPTPEATLKRWRQEALQMGLPGLFVVATNAFDFTDYRRHGFDALVEFPPHGIKMRSERPRNLLNPNFKGHLFSYRQLVSSQERFRTRGESVFPGVMPGWDNTPRRPLAATIFHGADPGLFQEWLEHAFARAANDLPASQRFVFVNAWNEWAEGAYLEPDRHYGYGLLEHIRSTVERYRDRSESQRSHVTPNSALSVADEAELLAFPDARSLLEGNVQNGQCEILTGSALPASSWYPGAIGTKGGTHPPSDWTEDPIIPSHAVQIFRLREAFYMPAYGAILSSDGEIMKVSSLQASIPSEKFEHLPHTEMRGGRLHLRPPDDIERLDRLIVTMPFCATYNYGHFLTDCLSAVAVTRSLQELREYDYGFPKLQPWHIRHLALCGVTEFRALEKAIYRVSDLIYLNCFGLFLQSPNTNYRTLRDLQLAHFGEQTSRPQNLYLSRRKMNKRTFASEALLEEKLSKKGFAIIRPEELDVDQQICLFRNARVIVGVSGAAFANILYCRADVTVVEIQPTRMDLHKWIAYMCAILGHRWRPYFCGNSPSEIPIIGGKPRPGLNIVFDLDVDDLIAFIDSVSPVTMSVGKIDAPG